MPGLLDVRDARLGIAGVYREGFFGGDYDWHVVSSGSHVRHERAYLVLVGVDSEIAPAELPNQYRSMAGSRNRAYSFLIGVYAESAHMGLCDE